MADDAASAQQRVQELEEHLDELLEMYGEGLTRINAALDDEQRAALAADPVVASVLLMHDLYPVSLETRVREALDEVRPYLASHDGDVELVGLSEGVLRLKLLGSCHGCGASQATLEVAIEDALAAAAPDLVGLEVEGVVEARAVTPKTAPADTEWVVLAGADSVARGAHAQLAPELFVANIAGTLLAYRDACADCGARLSSGMLVGGALTCTSCGVSYDLPRAGRAKDRDGLQLEPIPLLRGGGEIKVAMPKAQEAEHSGCELCGIGLSDDHRHLLHLDERRIVCVCETCWSIRSGDAEYRPTGARRLWLDDFTLSDADWAAFEIPIGLAFMMRSGVSGEIVALYPSPAGATECELDLAAWERVCAANPVLERLEPDAEALIVNRLADPPQHAIVPIDECYRLVGLVKSRWEGISGGSAIERAVEEFFEGLRGKAIAA
jgi:Fe-S cluster biogenesis protein NfuA/nitrite reductase/ring-hydroxylating ferredoxin subunit